MGQVAQVSTWAVCIHPRGTMVPSVPWMPCMELWCWENSTELKGNTYCENNTELRRFWDVFYGHQMLLCKTLCSVHFFCFVFVLFLLFFLFALCFTFV